MTDNESGYKEECGCRTKMGQSDNMDMILVSACKDFPNCPVGRSGAV